MEKSVSNESESIARRVEESKETNSTHVNKDCLLKNFKSLTKHDQIDFACEMGKYLDSSKCNMISKFWRKQSLKRKATEGLSRDETEDTPKPIPHSSGILPFPPKVNTSAWNTYLIFHGDKIPVNGIVSLDVERVDLKKLQGESVHKQVAAT